MQSVIEPQEPIVIDPYFTTPVVVPPTTVTIAPDSEALNELNASLRSFTAATIASAALAIACILCVVIGAYFHEWITITVGISLGIASIFIVLHKRMMYGWIAVRPDIIVFWKIEMWIQAVALYVVQTVLMDIFMHRSNVFHWPWIVFDVIVLIAIAAMGHGYHHRPTATSTFSSGQMLCLLSLSAYISLIFGKSCVLHARATLSDAGFWSYSIFILLLGISIPIYFILRWSQGRAMIPEDERSVIGEPSREWQSYTDYMRLAINIADSIAILSLVSPLQRQLHGYDVAALIVTLVFMCIAHAVSVFSFFGPAMFYYLTYRDNRITPFGSLLHHLPFVLVDGLLFSLRMVAWLHMKYELSAFILKNVFLFFMAAKASKSLHYHIQVYSLPYSVEDNLQCTPRIPQTTFMPTSIPAII